LSISERRLLVEVMLEVAECLRVMRRIIGGRWVRRLETLCFALMWPRFWGWEGVGGGEAEETGLQVRERREPASL